MAKAVFFDWINTIAHPEPDRHEQYCQVCREFGVELSPEKVMRGIFIADNQLPEGRPVKWSESQDDEVYVRHQEIILAEAGVKLPKETILKIMKRIGQLIKESTFVLYDDVLPTLKRLKEQGLTLGLLTNLTMDMNLLCRKLRLEPYLDFVVTAKEVGADKPEPPIFLAALERAKVNASEAVYVGDQYDTDVVGARGVGIKPILIDRHDLSPEVSDCPRIRTLPQMVEYI